MAEQSPLPGSSDATSSRASRVFMPPVLASANIRSVAIFRALQLGDMLCAVPALRAFRAGFPDAWITLVGLPWAEAFACRFQAYVDDFIPFPGHPALPEQPVCDARLPAFYETVRRRGFDLAVQLHGSGEVSNGIVAAFGARSTVGFHAGDGHKALPGHFLPFPGQGREAERLSCLPACLGLPCGGSDLEFPLTDQDFAELAASRLAAGLAPGGYVCIHPGARSQDKCWPVEHFAEVGERLAGEFGLTVVLTGSARERDLAAAVADCMRNCSGNARPLNAAAAISIGAMAALMSRARLLVCNDTGVSHIAAGLALPSTVVFSKSDMARWAPRDARLHRCIWDPEGCRVEAVVDAARDLLREASAVAA
jgi:ADP-heptose:LPS heptosyltransferase